MITKIPTACPDLQNISMEGLPRDPAIISAVSGLLTTSRVTPKSFSVDSPLTQEAYGVLYQSPDLREVYTVIDGPISLPTIVLPNLTRMGVKFGCNHDWLQGFHGASLGRLALLVFRSESESIGRFLDAFGRVAFTNSISVTLSTLLFCTSRSWKPNYRSLLPFTHLTRLDIESSCTPSCSSTIDDDTVADLAQAMSKLEFLRLGGQPCETPTGVTTKGLSALAYHCPHLSQLCIHFQLATLDPPEIPVLAFSGGPRETCSLTSLEVGYIPLPEESTLMVALTLLRVFPELETINYSDVRWEKVADAI